MKKLIFLIFIGIFMISLTFVSGIYTPPSYTNVTIVLKSSYTPPSYTNVTIVLGGVTSEPPADSCTYISGNWVIDCIDNCVISSNVAGNGNNFSARGSGTFTMTANISGFKIYHFGNNCYAICKGGCIKG